MKFVRTYISTYIATTIIMVIAIILIVVFVAPGRCEHDAMVKLFSFQFENSTAMSTIKPYCNDCNQYFGHTYFRGNPNDTSYLEALRENSDSDEIVAGEYYTITAIVTFADYYTHEKRIRCEVQSGNIRVDFSVEFQGEYEEAVGLLKAGDEITFHGRYYDTGCGFTDSELIR